ncbi:type II toxin-antitoxin system VapC family toxin [Alkalihalobacterium alkalinitrilicum]|uniref:type II toxin-antitoxin system VapC family toxin n=1 Tax=Alkalihalobacterium alkalinitrilicum TaxID=427920 RepID=UPI00099577DB|nr:PIN domain-containing protein [Alkalihalobacterium alkalinitrilicum]
MPILPGNLLLSEQCVTNIMQASVYVDACFILAYLDEDDERTDKVANFIDNWSNNQIKMGISSHIFAEVVGVLLINKVERSLAIYTDHTDDIELYGLSKLSEEDQRDILSVEAAKNLYEIKESIKQKNNNEGEEHKVTARDILKVGKRHEKRKELLEIFYGYSLQMFEEFIYNMQEHFSIEVEILSTDYSTIETASQYIRLHKLESYDAIHLTMAKKNSYDYFVTLDKDFIQDFTEFDQNFLTNVIYVA